MDTLELRKEGRRLARTATSSLSDPDANELINQCIATMAQDVKGFKAHDILTIGALFTTRTHYGIRIEIIGGSNALSATDIAITSTERTRGTGAQVAADLQTAIQAAGAATATVAWTDFYFTVDASDSTSIEILSPEDLVTYADASELLFGRTGLQTGTSWVSTFPNNCTVEVALPADYTEGSLEAVEWDGDELYEVPESWSMSTDWNARPARYSIRDGYLRLVPSPTENGILEIWYRSTPAEIAVSAFDTAIPSAIPRVLHKSLSYLLASEMAKGNFDEEIGMLRWREYWRQLSIWKADRANNVSAGRVTNRLNIHGRPYRVIPTAEP